ncbi:MAG: DNA gyrase C-terminal beta-propeller domain-containing protein, partial [Pseudomonadales bacterium]
VDQFSVIGRGGQGVICMKRSDRNGALVGVTDVGEGFEVILISDQGTLVRTRVDEVSSQGRNTQGVRLINLGEGEALVGLASFEEPELEDILLDETGDNATSDVTATEVPTTGATEDSGGMGEGAPPDDDLTEDDHDEA